MVVASGGVAVTGAVVTTAIGGDVGAAVGAAVAGVVGNGVVAGTVTGATVLAGVEAPTCPLLASVVVGRGFLVVVADASNWPTRMTTEAAGSLGVPPTGVWLTTFP